MKTASAVLVLFFALTAAHAQETPRQLGGPPAVPTPATPAADTVRRTPAPQPRQLAAPPVLPDSVREQQRRQAAAAPPVETSRFAVGLKSGQVLRAYDVELRQPMFGRRFLLLDGSQRFDLDQVRFYEDESGHYVRTTLPNSKREATLRREKAGRISLYSITTTQYNNNPYGGGFGRMGYGSPYGFGGPTYRTVKTLYFSKDNNPVEDLTVRNLSLATLDNPGSQALLADARRYQRLTSLSYVGGAGFLIAGLVSSLNSNTNGISPLVYGAIPFMILPLVIGGKQQDHIRQAITLYNQPPR